MSFTCDSAEIQRRLKRQWSPPPLGTDEGQQQQQPMPSPLSSSEQGLDSSHSRVSLKWPNDVLIGGSKVAGVLIEAELPFLLVGIGVNVRHKPDVPRQGPDRGRPATCLADFGADSTDEVRVYVRSADVCIVAVSYTHLTLPTIYSV